MSRAILSLGLVVATLSACAREPCPDGVLDGNLIIEGGGYYAESLRLGPYAYLGTPGNAGIERCRVIEGTVHFTDGLTDFSDFDALEHIQGRLTFGTGDGYQTKDVGDGLTRDVVEGFNRLRRIDGNLDGSMALIYGLESLEVVGGTLHAGALTLYSLREVGQDFAGLGGVGGTFEHLANLEIVGRDLTTAGGDFGSLTSLRSVGRDLWVEWADVDFTPPALESVGRDLTIRNNDSVSAVAVPSMVRVGGDLTISENRGATSELTHAARAAFSGVDVAGWVLICRNGVDDPCPYDDECWEHYGDDYCCPIDMEHGACLQSLRGG